MTPPASQHQTGLWQSPGPWTHGTHGTVLASNGHIHDALLDLVRDVPFGRDYQSLIRARA